MTSDAIPSQHITVLLNEAVEGLVVDPDGFYVDGTFGRGGHSELILKTLSDQGSLLAIDKDPQAINIANLKLADEKRFEIAQGSFTELSKLLAEKNQLGKVSGVLLDLGVASPQLDQAERGFSFTNDGPLDMRMDPTQGQSAKQWLSEVKEEDLAKVLREYGEEKFARRIARAVVAAREEVKIETTHQFAKIVAEAHPAWEVGRHPATKTFMAIRLFLNQELEDLTAILQQVLDVLQPGGRLVVISFHSLEDRIVKRFMRDKAKGDSLPRGVPVTEDKLNKTLKIVGKAVKPSREEVEQNVRSRSAIMRVAERLGPKG
ncbi:MAG: 16S rRNA (cytosine(1402)-N(4))-methyltransferase RsmH [Cellvibrionaceae bacterium]